MIFQSSLVPQNWIASNPHAEHPSGMSANRLQSSFFIHSQPPAAEKSETHLSQLFVSGTNSKDSKKMLYNYSYKTMKHSIKIIFS